MISRIHTIKQSRSKTHTPVTVIYDTMTFSVVMIWAQNSRLNKHEVYYALLKQDQFVFKDIIDDIHMYM